MSLGLRDIRMNKYDDRQYRWFGTVSCHIDFQYQISLSYYCEFGFLWLSSDTTTIEFGLVRTRPVEYMYGMRLALMCLYVYASVCRSRTRRHSISPFHALACASGSCVHADFYRKSLCAMRPIVYLADDGRTRLCYQCSISIQILSHSRMPPVNESITDSIPILHIKAYVPSAKRMCFSSRFVSLSMYSHRYVCLCSICVLVCELGRMWLYALVHVVERASPTRQAL